MVRRGWAGWRWGWHVDGGGDGDGYCKLMEMGGGVGNKTCLDEVSRGITI